MSKKGQKRRNKKKARSIANACRKDIKQADYPQGSSSKEFAFRPITQAPNYTNHELYARLAQTAIDKAEISAILKKSLFNRLRDKGDLLVSSAWYLTEEQALKFAKMTSEETEDLSTNGGKEISLIKDILNTDPFAHDPNINSLTFIDLGCGNGIKGRMILQKLLTTSPYHRLHYYAIDTSPYMAAKASGDIYDTFNKTFVHNFKIHFAAFNDEYLVSYLGGATAQSLIDLVNKRKKVLQKIHDRFDEGGKSEGYLRYVATEVTRSQSLNRTQMLNEISHADSLENVLHNIAQSHYLNPSQTKGEAKKKHKQKELAIKRALSTLDHLPLAYTIKKIKQIFLFLNHPHRRSHFDPKRKDETFVFYQDTDIHELLDKIISDAKETPDLFSRPYLLRLHRLLRCPTMEARAKAASESVTTLELGFHNNDPRTIYSSLQNLLTHIRPLTYLIPNGEYIIGPEPSLVSSGIEDLIHMNVIPGHSKVTRDLGIYAPLGTAYTDFLNGDLLKLFRSAIYHNCMTFPRTIVGLLGQTIGNFSEDERSKILSNIHSSLEDGGYLFLGAELRPGDDHPHLEKEVERLRKYYGEPTLNDGPGAGEEFLRYSTKQIGINDEDLDYHVDFIDNTVQMYFTVNKDGVYAEHDGEKLPLENGQRINIGRSHKFSAEELCNLVSDAGFEIEQAPETGRYMVILAKKKGGEGDE